MNIIQNFVKFRNVILNKRITMTASLALLVAVFCNTSMLLSQSCSCTDFLYLNDDDLGIIHKFEINPADGSVSEIGSPWASGIDRPHGIAADDNGFLYISAGATNGDLHQLSCDGTILDPMYMDGSIDGDNISFRNYGIKDGIIYLQSRDSDDVIAINLCDGSLVGRMDITGSNIDVWGMIIDDTNWYVADRMCNCLMTGPLDPAMFTDPATNSGTLLFNIQGGSDDPMGITKDENGNFYVVVDQTLSGTSNTSILQKYDSSGTLILSTPIPNDNTPNTNDGEPGSFGARGIVYSEGSGYIYVGNFENCITVYDADLVEQTSLNIGNPSGNSTKGLGLVTECCPDPADQNLTETICAADATGISYALNELFPCAEGVICEGMWMETENTSGGAIVFDPCDLSVLVDGMMGCATYEMASDGAGNKQCGAFTITLEICIDDCAVDPVACDCPEEYNLCWNESGFVEPPSADLANFPYSDTITDIDGSGVDLMVTIDSPSRDADGDADPQQSYVSPGSRCGCDFADPLGDYLSCAEVFRFWQDNTVSNTNEVVWSFSEPILLPEWGFGGFKIPTAQIGTQKALASFTFYDGPNGTGNVVHNGGSEAQINQGDPLTATINEVQGFGNHNTVFDGTSYHYEGLDNDRGWTILNLGSDVQVQSIKMEISTVAWTDSAPYTPIVPSGQTNSGYVGSFDYTKCSCTSDPCPDPNCANITIQQN